MTLSPMLAPPPGGHPPAAAMWSTASPATLIGTLITQCGLAAEQARLVLLAARDREHVSFTTEVAVRIVTVPAFDIPAGLGGRRCWQVDKAAAGPGWWLYEIGEV